LGIGRLPVVHCHDACVWWWLGSQSALEWSTGYLVEICLSVDNVFVFTLMFTYFKVPVKH
jgi:tellurite resistance protein TerC